MHVQTAKKQKILYLPIEKGAKRANSSTVKAKKSFGQHFLTSDSIARRIAESLQPNHAYDQVLEVGPGKGMLTQFLIGQPFTLRLVEADQDMVAYLQRFYPDLAPQIIEADFLRLRLDEVMDHKPFALIGNYPYNISSQILFRMLEYRAYIPELVGMFQREMAVRVIAPPGNKDYGVISVLVQAFYEGKLLFTVKQGSFNPPPKVQSAVIRLVRKANQNLGCDERLFRRVVKTAFSQRRKMLRNTLKPLVPAGTTLLQDPFFEKRPEQLSVEDYVKLTNTIQNLGLPGKEEEE